MEKNKQAPFCKCGKAGVERFLINSSFWYCVGCKDEVRVAKNKTTIQFNADIDPAALMAPRIGNMGLPGIIGSHCPHHNITRNLTNGTWTCCNCGLSNILDPNNI